MATDDFNVGSLPQSERELLDKAEAHYGNTFTWQGRRYRLDSAHVSCPRRDNFMPTDKVEGAVRLHLSRFADEPAQPNRRGSAIPMNVGDLPSIPNPRIEASLFASAAEFFQTATPTTD